MISSVGLACVEVAGPFHMAMEPSHPDFMGDGQKCSRVREIAPFFTDARLRVIVGFLTETDTHISLRDLDHLVTHMAPAIPMSWNYKDTVVSLHCVYRTWLATWKRRLFDCFRRFGRIYFHIDGMWYATTPAQVNFFYFAFENGLIAYARTQANTIHSHRHQWKKNRANMHPVSTDKRKFEVVSHPCVVRF